MTPAIPSSDPPAAKPATPPQLAGDLLIWMLIALEMATFGLMFVVFAVMRRMDPVRFAEGQAKLHLGIGTINTLLLIAGSAAVAWAVQMQREERPRAAAAAWALGWLFGGGFLRLKWHEYALRFADGMTLEHDRFDQLYFLLTGFHFMHVLAGWVLLALMAVLAWRRRAAPPPPDALHGAQTVAAFWHLVDLLWIVLFALVYVIRVPGAAS